jgi:hypothetical protein
MIWAVYFIPGMLQPKASKLQKKQNCLSYIMPSYEASLPQKKTLKIWNNQDKADASPLS